MHTQCWLYFGAHSTKGKWSPLSQTLWCAGAPTRWEIWKRFQFVAFVHFHGVNLPSIASHRPFNNWLIKFLNTWESLSWARPSKPLHIFATSQSLWFSDSGPPQSFPQGGQPSWIFIWSLTWERICFRACSVVINRIHVLTSCQVGLILSFLGAGWRPPSVPGHGGFSVKAAGVGGARGQWSVGNMKVTAWANLVTEVISCHLALFY